MTDLFLIIGSITAATVVAGGAIVFRRKPRPINQSRFQTKWREMQKLCATKATWRQAVIEADKLLDRALKRKRFHGKTMGERLTKAQHVLTDNEAVWFGHKLRGKADIDPTLKLKESDVKRALVGIRQALKDLGALPNGRRSNTK